MRKLTLDQIKSKIDAKGRTIDHKVNMFRSHSKEQGWLMRRVRPREADEIKALNYIARKTLRDAMKNNTVHYDKERRVFIVDKYRRI